MVSLRKLIDEDVEWMRKELKRTTMLEALASSQHGKPYIEFLSEAIDECKHNWESTGLTIDEDKLVGFRRSLVSKVQTLRALRDKLIHASEEKQRLERELQGEST